MQMNKRMIFHVLNNLLMTLCALLTAFSVRFRSLDKLAELGLARVFVFVFIVVLVTFLVESYKFHQTPNREILLRIILAPFFSFLMLSVLYYMFPSLLYGRGVLVPALVLFGILQFLGHTGYWVSRKVKDSNRVLVLGTGELAEEVGKILPASDYELSGYLNCSEPDERIQVPHDAILEMDDRLYETVKREGAQQIVVSLSEKRGIFPLEELLNCKLSGIEVTDAPTFYEKVTGKLLVEKITPSWFIFSKGFRSCSLFRFVKRITDIFFSSLGIVLTLPFLPVVALTIKLDSPGPVFFKQERVGEMEENFIIYKFRTMRTDAEKGTGAVWAQEKDPRVTRVGEFLRKCRIDEIPQLLNILMGNMSLVGPRPERPEFVKKLKELVPYYSERHLVKPGLSGWAQVRYPYGDSVEDALEKLRYDLFYIKNLSLTFDFLIILQTIKVVLYRRGSR